MALDSITDRAIREDEWEALRTIRLRALTLHPNYFAWKAADAQAQPESFWRDYLNGNGKAVFGLYDAQALVGITGVFTHHEYPDGKTADFGMTFIDLPYRQQGLSQRLYAPRIEWAKANGFNRIEISHHIKNISSKNAMLRNGFQFTHEKMKQWPVGSHAMELFYEMKL